MEHMAKGIQLQNCKEVEKEVLLSFFFFSPLPCVLKMVAQWESLKTLEMLEAISDATLYSDYW